MRTQVDIFGEFEPGVMDCGAYVGHVLAPLVPRILDTVNFYTIMEPRMRRMLTHNTHVPTLCKKLAHQTGATEADPARVVTGFGYFQSINGLSTMAACVNGQWTAKSEYGIAGLKTSRIVAAYHWG